jgi:hypothetical protein
MRVQQVVEELHVQLIVLHDQDCFGLRVHGFPDFPVTPARQRRNGSGCFRQY